MEGIMKRLFFVLALVILGSVVWADTPAYKNADISKSSRVPQAQDKQPLRNDAVSTNVQKIYGGYVYLASGHVFPLGVSNKELFPKGRLVLVYVENGRVVGVEPLYPYPRASKK